MSDSLNILIYGRNAERYQDALRARGITDPVFAASDPDTARTYAAEADVLLSWRFPADLYREARRLRWVQCMGAGVEDIMAAQGLPEGVVVTRIVDQFGPMLAEYVFAELLARVRRIDRVRALQAQRRWEHFIAGTLQGQTIGVAGLGSIGAEIVRKARAFDMRVYGLSRTGTAGGLVDRHFGPVHWPQFVADLDVLVLTLPLTAQTRGVVNGEVLASMKPGSVLVNVGRGGLCPEAELIAALRAGRPGGAILDVFEVEPLPEASPLWEEPGVTVTPHVSGPSLTDEVTDFFVDNLRRLRGGEALQGVVDREAGY